MTENAQKENVRVRMRKFFKITDFGCFGPKIARNHWKPPNYENFELWSHFRPKTAKIVDFCIFHSFCWIFNSHEKMDI